MSTEGKMFEGTQLDTVSRFAQFSRDDFEAEIRRLWDAGGEYVEKVVEQVNQGEITPMQGFGIVSSVAAEILGYNALHGQATPVDLASVIIRERRVSALQGG